MPPNTLPELSANVRYYVLCFIVQFGKVPWIGCLPNYRMAKRLLG